MNKKTTVAIIGAGPAGVTAAIYLKRALIDVLVIEKGAPGGKVNITAEIENYPGFDMITGPDLAFKLYEQLERFDLRPTYGDVSKISKEADHFLIETDDGNIEAKYVIYATGTNERKLGVFGEDRFSGKGVSYCAVCDGSFYKGKPVAVIGGGNSAVQEALYLAAFTGKVYLIHRRQGFRAEEVLVQKAKNHPNIELVLDATIDEIRGDDKVRGVVVNNLLNHSKTLIEVDAVFPFVGQIPATEPLKDLGVLDAQGYIIVDEKMETSVENLFGAGDCNAKLLRQIVTATNDGAVAAIAITHRI